MWTIKRVARNVGMFSVRCVQCKQIPTRTTRKMLEQKQIREMKISAVSTLFNNTNNLAISFGCCGGSGDN